MKFSGKMCFEIILKVTKNQGFTLSLEDTFFKKPQGGSRVKADSGTIDIDVMLTNRPRHFYKTRILENGFSDHHNMILSFFRTHFERLKSKKLEYRNYKKFDKSKFLLELDQELWKGKM